jgi:hypothetical protein
MRVALALLCLLSLAPAVEAVPACVPGTMADYLALADGCRLGAITVSDFSYSGFSESFFLSEVFDVPPSDVSVVPSLPLGASSLRLTFSDGWTGVDISYTAQAEAAWIRQFNLSFLLGGGPSAAGIGGNGLFVFIDPSNPFGPPERLFDTRSFDPISLTTVHISGGSASHPFGGIGSFAFDVVTPEPTTFLVWATGGTGLVIARWRRHRSDGTARGRSRRSRSTRHCR